MRCVLIWLSSIFSWPSLTVVIFSLFEITVSLIFSKKKLRFNCTLTLFERKTVEILNNSFILCYNFDGCMHIAHIGALSNFMSKKLTSANFISLRFNFGVLFNGFFSFVLIWRQTNGTFNRIQFGWCAFVQENHIISVSGYTKKKTSRLSWSTYQNNEQKNTAVNYYIFTAYKDIKTEMTLLCFHAPLFDRFSCIFYCCVPLIFPSVFVPFAAKPAITGPPN